MPRRLDPQTINPSIRLCRLFTLACSQDHEIELSPLVTLVASEAQQDMLGWSRSLCHHVQESRVLSCFKTTQGVSQVLWFSWIQGAGKGPDTTFCPEGLSEHMVLPRHVEEARQSKSDSVAWLWLLGDRQHIFTCLWSTHLWNSRIDLYIYVSYLLSV